MTQEQRIKVLEEEMRHEQEMRRIRGERLDAHDASFAFVRDTLDVVGVRLDKLTVHLEQIAEMQAKTEGMLQDLIQAITRTHGNGKEPK